MIYKTKGIILKRTNLGEADRIVTIFTQKFGKIKVVAKGVRKTLSKMAGHLEPFCLTNFQIVEGRNLDTITGATVEKCFFGLRSDLEKTNACFYMAEIVDKMVEESVVHEEIFELLDLTFSHADELISPLLISYFEINFLAEMGFKPELYECVSCQTKIESGENNFDFNHGGLVCGSCGTGRSISDKAIKMIRLFLDHDFSKIKKIQVTPDLISEIQIVTSYYLKNIHQKDMKSEKYLTR
ncbi:MAG: DNA repair protein RecO [Candidatus Berkelbacteria bacterium]